MWTSMKWSFQQNKLGSRSSGCHRAAISPCFFKGHAALRCSCPWEGFVLYCSLILVDFNCPNSEHYHRKNVNVPWLWKAEKTWSCVNWSLEKVAVFWFPAFSAGYGQLRLTAVFDWTRLIFHPRLGSLVLLRLCGWEQPCGAEPAASLVL